MPAAIRIDIHMGSFGMLAHDVGEASADYLNSLSVKLATAVQQCLIEHTNSAGGSPTDNDSLVPVIQDGLGVSWPQPSDFIEPRHFLDGGMEYLEALAAGTAKHYLGATSSYDDGAKHIYFGCNFDQINYISTAGIAICLFVRVAINKPQFGHAIWLQEYAMLASKPLLSRRSSCSKSDRRRLFRQANFVSKQKPLIEQQSCDGGSMN